MIRFSVDKDLQIIFAEGTDRERENFLLNGLEEYAKKFIDIDTFERNDWNFFVYAGDKLIGGAHGRELKDNWLYVELFYVDEKYRGNDLGTALMQKIEGLAKDKKCIGIYLDTLSFEARGFYEKVGFVVHGELKDYPTVGFSKYFLHKRL